MASIRRLILLALRDRLREISGWDVQVAGAAHDPDAEVSADVYYTSETKTLENSEQYHSTLQCAVFLSSGIEHAAEEDEGIPALYIERLVTEVEKVVHSPDSWGLNPDFTDMQVTGHDVLWPDGEESLIGAEIQLRCQFRHNYQNPEV